jgi:hypothetical protein
MITKDNLKSGDHIYLEVAVRKTSENESGH